MTDADLSTLSPEALMVMLLKQCRTQHAEVMREIGGLKSDLKLFGSLTAQAIEAQLEPIRTRIGGIADDTSAVRRTVNGADFLAHTKVIELEERVRALEQRHTANGGE